MKSNWEIAYNFQKEYSINLPLELIVIILRYTYKKKLEIQYHYGIYNIIEIRYDSYDIIKSERLKLINNKIYKELVIFYKADNSGFFLNSTNTNMNIKNKKNLIYREIRDFHTDKYIYTEGIYKFLRLSSID